MDFKGKCVLVVGASSGMGRRLALRLAEEGAHVTVTARRQALLEQLVLEMESKGGPCAGFAADAQDPLAAEQVVRQAVEHLGRIDIIVLNAGGAPALDLRKMTATEVTGYMRSNYDVAVNYLMPVLQQMARQGGGLVAHTNSLAGFLGVPLQGPYSAAKGALRLLIDTCRVEFAPLGIRFVSVYPGFVATAQTANDGMPAPLEISEDEAVRHMLRALGRERRDYLFPASLRWLTRLALLLPKPMTTWLLGASMAQLAAPSDAGARP